MIMLSLGKHPDDRSQVLSRQVMVGFTTSFYSIPTRTNFVNVGKKILNRWHGGKKILNRWHLQSLADVARLFRVMSFVEQKEQQRKRYTD